MFATLQRQLIYYPEVAPEDTLLRVAAANGLRDWRTQVATSSAGTRRPPATPPGAWWCSTAMPATLFIGNTSPPGSSPWAAIGRFTFLSIPATAPGRAHPLKRVSRPPLPTRSRPCSRKIHAPLFLVGESLGSGVATYLASTLPAQVAGLLLVTPFTSLTDVAAGHYPFLPVRALLRERYDSLVALEDYRGPVAFLIAGSDEIVPAALGRKLHDSYRGPKWLREQAGAGHNTLDFDPAAGWWREVAEFLAMAESG